MRLVFLAVALLGSVYIFCMPRRIDIFTFAHSAGLLYFMPGLLGVVHPHNPWDLDMVEPIHETAYLVMSVVLIGILIGAFASDWAIEPERSAPPPSSPPLPVHNVALVLTCLSFAAMIATMGLDVLLSDKSEIMSHLNRWYLLCTISASIVAVYSFLAKAWVCFVLALCILLFDVFVGFRNNFVIAAGAIVLVWARNRGIVRLIPQKLGYLLAAMVFTFVVMIYKNLHVVVKLGRWDIVAAQLGSPEFYVNSVLRHEPDGIQSILNRVIATNYHTDVEQLYDLILLFVVGPGELFGATSLGFGREFDPQTYLFPGLDYGIASNIWAQMWSIGGMSGVVIFTCIFTLVSVVMARVIARAQNPVVGIVALCAMVWVFYIHRNSIGYESGLLRRYVLVFLVCWGLAMLLVRERARPRANRLGSDPPARNRASRIRGVGWARMQRHSGDAAAQTGRHCKRQPRTRRWG